MTQSAEMRKNLARGRFDIDIEIASVRRQRRASRGGDVESVHASCLARLIVRDGSTKSSNLAIVIRVCGRAGIDDLDFDSISRALSNIPRVQV